MTGNGIFKAALLLATLYSAAVAHANSPVQLREGAPQPDIVVTGKSNPGDDQIARHARAISRIGDPRHDPLARFSEPICPGVLGLPEDAAGIVVDRIRYDAERVGAPVENKTDCRANLLVIFTRDGRAEVQKLFKTHGYLFDGIDTPEARELKEDEGPARAWSVTQLRNRHGQEEDARFVSGRLQLGDDSGTLRMGPIRVTSAPSSDSRLFLASRLDITASVVIIDLAAIDGMPVARIADYAAMRGLARTRPSPGDTGADTILSLFDPGAQAPREMTVFDLAYLRSLYDAGSNVPASVKILNVSRTVEKDAQRTSADRVARP